MHTILHLNKVIIVENGGKNTESQHALDRQNRNETLFNYWEVNKNEEFVQLYIY